MDEITKLKIELADAVIANEHRNYINELIEQIIELYGKNK
jgi:hypothetical protein